MAHKTSSASNWLLWSVAIASLVLSVISFGRGLLSNSNRVVAVDAVKLISEYQGMNEVRRTQQQRNQQLQSNLDTLKRELEMALDRLQKSKASSKNELSVIEEEIQVRQRNLITYEQSVNDQIKKQDEELANTVLTKVNDYVKRYGEKNGYTIILASTQFGNIAFVEENSDITMEVLDGLNREYTNTR